MRVRLSFLAVGTFCPTGSMEETACPPGAFASEANSSACQLCPAGTFQDTPRAVDCRVCMEGFYCPFGSSAPQPCYAGSYQGEVGAYSASDCLTVEAGSFAPAGSSQTQLCPPGSISANVNATGCELCAAGKYQSNAGKTSCEDCTPGYYCLPASSSPQPCPPGTFRTTTGARNVTDCSDVEEGFFSTLGSSAPEACTTILATYTCPGRAADTVNEIPGSQPVAKLLPQWIADLAIQENLQLSCPPGKETVGAQCAPCRKGHYCIGGYALRCPDNFWHNLTNQASNSSCIACPPSGTRCLTGDTLEVLPGYYMQGYLDQFAYKCASATSCLGGPLVFGEDSCALGHTGIICGGCKDTWYRGRRRCLSCIDLSDGSEDALDSTKTGTLVGMALAAFSVFLSIFLYLRPPGVAGACFAKCGEMMKPWFEKYHIDLAAARENIPALMSGLFKIILSYAQCLGAITRFPQIRWPRLFVEFMNMLNEALPELLTVLPAECVYGKRLGFYVELVSTLSLPVIGIAFTWAVILTIRFMTLARVQEGGAGIFADEYGKDPMHVRKAAVRRAIRASKAVEDSDEDALDPATLEAKDYLDDSWLYTFFYTLKLASSHPKVQNVYIFMMLWIYPMLCRKSLSIFDCVAAGVNAEDGSTVRLLRDDPVEHCGTGVWNFYAIAAGCGILFYALGVPYIAFSLARNHRRSIKEEEAEEKERLELRLVAKVGRKKTRKGSSLLARIYKPQYWFVEPFALLHNFFFTGVIHIIWAETRVQIWVGVFVSLIVYICFLLSRPYKYFSK